MVLLFDHLFFGNRKLLVEESKNVTRSQYNHYTINNREQQQEQNNIKIIKNKQ